MEKRIAVSSGVLGLAIAVAISEKLGLKLNSNLQASVQLPNPRFMRMTPCVITVSNKSISWDGAEDKGAFKSDDLEVILNHLAEPEIIIGDHAVEFTPDGVQVGCTFVYKSQVEKIYKRLFQ